MAQVEGVPTDKLRILFKGHTKGFDEPEEITDEPYWADLPRGQRHAFYRKDIGGVGPPRLCRLSHVAVLC